MSSSESKAVDAVVSSFITGIVLPILGTVGE